MGRRSCSAAGFSVAELLAAVALGAVLAAVASPAVGAAGVGLASRGAARTVAGAFREAAALARARQHAVGWEVAAAPLAMRLVEDGDHDGLRRDDLDRGIDRVISGWRTLGAGPQPVAAVVGCACPDVDGGLALEPGARGIRFGASSLVSFSPAGTASSGSLYLSAPGGPTLAIRVLGTSGRVRVFEFSDGAGTWAER
jgi:hypothetical protein